VEQPSLAERWIGGIDLIEDDEHVGRQEEEVPTEEAELRRAVGLGSVADCVGVEVVVGVGGDGADVPSTRAS
jgi:hypothetical protein